MTDQKLLTSNLTPKLLYVTGIGHLYRSFTLSFFFLDLFFPVFWMVAGVRVDINPGVEVWARISGVRDGLCNKINTKQSKNLAGSETQ